MKLPTEKPRPGRLRLYLKPLVFLTHMALSAGLAATLPGVAHAQASRQYDIPAGPLDAALNSFAVQAGVSLAIDAEKLKGLRSAGLKGNYAIDSGFAALLHNTDYSVARTASGYILVALPKTLERPARATDSREATLAPVLVVDRHESAGTAVIDRHTMDAMPLGNGDITSLLKVLPGVQFDNYQLHTGSQGEIAPADISINGNKFYQNLYQLDGMSFNNDIDPASGDQHASNREVTSASQGFAIDSSLLCKITVRDSNVAAEYGGFTGGVVSAETCPPTEDFAGQISVGTTRSSWMKYKIAREEEYDYENPISPDNASEFEKWTYRLALQGKVTENFSLIGSFIRRTSTIPLSGDSAYKNGEGRTPEQTRQTDNFFIKGFWKPTRDNDVDFSVQYAPTDDERFIPAIKDSQFTYKAGGLGLNAGWVSRFNPLTVSQRLTWTEMESSRDGDSSLYKTWRYSADDKNWGTTTLSSEGGYGDIDQKQKTLAYQFKADWEPLQLLAGEHRFQAGFELASKESFYHRKTQYESYYGPATWAGTCTRADGSTDPYCSTANTSNGWPGQYLRSRVIYLAGKFTVKEDSRAIFLQDEMKYGNFKARLGLRYENTDLAPESTLAPRSAFFYDLSGNGDSVLEAGANRYYGRGFMSYYMQANRLSLQSATSGTGFTRTGLTDWGPLTMSTTAAGYHFEQLKMPYDDEAMLAFKQKWGGVLWGIKYVDRKSRDQVVQVLRSAGNRWFDNVGEGEAQTLSLTAETQVPLKLFGTRTSLFVGLDRTDSETSHADYFSNDHDFNANGSAGQDKIVWDGKLIDALDKPADNYNRPWTGRML
ncbi:MAG: TonB-dependent receptor, partial [Dechloromonas sp.]